MTLGTIAKKALVPKINPYSTLFQCNLKIPFSQAVHSITFKLAFIAEIKITSIPKISNDLIPLMSTFFGLFIELA